MEQEPGHDPEHDGPDGPQPGGGRPGPDGDEESEFGPWDALEGTLGAAKEREDLLSGFAPGGAWDRHPPGPELVAALARAVGPQWRCPVATGEELIGLLRAMAAVQSWAGAGMLGMIRALIRDDDLDFLGRPRHGDLPDVWDDSLVHEIALALAVSAPSAAKTTRAAWELGARLPGVELLLRDGTLDLPRARLVAEVFEQLSDENAARAQELLLPELTATPRKTYTQVERIATAIAAAVDPGLAERRRESAEKHLSRVTMFREGSGAAGLSGRDLPVGDTLAAYANLDARARRYKDSGAFRGERIDRLRAVAYLDILNGISADARIACGHLSADADNDDSPDVDATADGEPADGEPDDGEPDDGEPDDGEPDDDDNPGSYGNGGGPSHGGPRGGTKPPPVGGSGRDGGSDDGSSSGGGAGGRFDRDGDDPADDRPGQAAPAPPVLTSADGSPPTLTDLVFPLATLLGQAERPGEGHGLGTIDPALGRVLAATATLSPHTTLCITVTDPGGIAIGHGCATAGKPGRPPDGPAPPLVALPARINLTITAGRLAAMLASPDPPGFRAAADWALIPCDSPRDPDWCRTWTLTLPSGPQFTVNLEPVPTYDCDHRNESHAYQPNAALRHLVQIRDRMCTFPTCSRQARESDFEHAIPYDQGGRTCGCNAGARSRKCHRVKQSPGWNVTQPKPGWHQWTTPRGRTYTQGPNRYPV